MIIYVKLKKLKKTGLKNISSFYYIKITQENIGGEKIVVEVEGYPHAQPVFPADTSEKDLPALVKAWAVNQDEVDAINAQAKIDAENVVEPTINAELKALEGKEI